MLNYVRHLTVRYKSSILRARYKSHLITSSEHIYNIDDVKYYTNYQTNRIVPISSYIMRTERCMICHGLVCNLCYMTHGRDFIDIFSLTSLDPNVYDDYVQDYPSDFIPI